MAHCPRSILGLHCTLCLTTRGSTLAALPCHRLNQDCTKLREDYIKYGDEPATSFLRSLWGGTPPHDPEFEDFREITFQTLGRGTTLLRSLLVRVYSVCFRSRAKIWTENYNRHESECRQSQGGR